LLCALARGIGVVPDTEETVAKSLKLSVGSQQRPVNQTARQAKAKKKAKSEKLQGGRDMPTRPNRCEGCPDPPSNKLPIREHDLYMMDSPIIVAFLCPECIAVDEGDDRNAKRRLRTRVKKQRDLLSQSRQERAD
jgi:hypothetical protein